MAKATKTTTSQGNINKVAVRMYRAGTGDCFLLQFKVGNTVSCNMLVDCGCILGARGDFEPWIHDMKKMTNGVIDILVVTHEHADHINGFKECSDLFDTFTFRKVWFGWTEDEKDELANDLRQNHSKLKLALQTASLQLDQLLKDGYYEDVFRDEYHSNLMMESKEYFIKSMLQLNSLNLELSPDPSGKIPSMAKLFADLNIIKDHTEVSFLIPGELLKMIGSLPGIRVFVLGPPRDAGLLDITEAEGEHYDKREKKSRKDHSFAAAVINDINGEDLLPFDNEAELIGSSPVKEIYGQRNWRQIDHDWLYSAGSLALRYERSINNTSLALALQFEGSERVMLFPGDAEFGNWKSWHDLQWNISSGGTIKTVNTEYLLNNTVFYKVGHHCSQNGSASRLGVEMMTHEDMTVMAPVNFSKINSGWLNTMPNDLLCANLIAKSKGKFYFSGDHKQIMPNIKTERVSVKQAHETELNKLNEMFDGKIFIDCEIDG